MGVWIRKVVLSLLMLQLATTVTAQGIGEFLNLSPINTPLTYQNAPKVVHQ